ncbi:unnamed protein product [Brassica rapa subsp. narinosa]
MQSESIPLRFCVKSSPRLFYNRGFLRHHRNSEVPSFYCAYLCSMSENSNSVNVTAGSCECDRWRVRHSSSSKSSVASLENRRLLTFAKFAGKHRQILNSFDRQNPRLLENLSESKAPG